MRKCLILLAAMFIFAGCAKVEQEVLLDSFEGELNSETVDFGAADGSAIEVTAEKGYKTDGEQSLKLAYDLKPSGYMWAARGFNLDVKGAARWIVKPEEVKWKKYKALSFSMYGHKDGGMVAFDIKDAGGEIWRFLLDGKFEGWQEMSCPLAEFFARNDWQPQDADKNGTLDFPIMSFQFEPRLPGQVTYYFDEMKVIR